VPGTNVRFGLDPILSLIPGLGDLASPAFTVLLLVKGLERQVPRVVLARMVLNAFIDAVIGLVPIAGNIGDIFWRANVKNLALLERHQGGGHPARRSDYVFVWTMAIVLCVLVIVPIAIAIWIGMQLWHWIAAHPV
jgi:hypothetical protein